MIIPLLALIILFAIFMQNKKNGEKEEGGEVSGYCSEGLQCGSKSDIEKIISKFRYPVWRAKIGNPTVPRSWIFAFIAMESCGNNYFYNQAIPSAGCMAIPKNVIESIDVNVKFPKALYNPFYNVMIGTYLLRLLIETYGLNIVNVYAHYKEGREPSAISLDRGKCVEELARRFGNYINIID